MKKVLALVSLLTGLLLPQSVTAYVRITTTTGATPRWTESSIPYAVSEAGSPYILNGSEFDAVQAAFQTWDSIVEADVSFSFQGTTSLHTAGRDGTNLVTFVDDTALGGLLGSTTLAATMSFLKNVGGQLVFEESDIAFNPSFALTTSGEDGRFDIQGVLTHEIGHLIGLDHSGLISSVMAPFAISDQTDHRFLLYDDRAGAADIYPVLTATGSRGSIEGTIRLNGMPVFGAHVVALDAGGTVLTSTVTAGDGGYTLRFLPTGQYRVYVEPFDGPVVPGHLPGFFSTLNDTFGTTFFGGVLTLNEASSVTVTAGNVTMGADINAFPFAASSLNLTRPLFASRVGRGESDTIRIGGVGVTSGISLSSSTPLIRFDSVSFGGRLSTTAPTSATLALQVDSAAPLGPKSIASLSGSTLSVLSGAIVVTEPPPSAITVSPSTGFFEGGTVVTISGRNFRPGVRAFVGGLPATNVVFLGPDKVQATVPANSPGPANLQVFNDDGTSGLLKNAFLYTAPPPVILAVEPPSGPPATVVVINGSNFDSRTQNVVVRFNGAHARTVSATGSRIETVVPFGATTGPLTVSVFGVEVDAGVFTVTDPLPSSNTAPAAVAFVDATVGAGGSELSFPIQPITGCSNSRDDGVAFVDLPISFTLFTDTFVAGTRISISTNGWISLDGASTPEFHNTSLPAATATRPGGSDAVIAAALVAPFFDDLILCGGATVTTRIAGVAPNRQFVVQWSGASILNEVGEDLGAHLTFELILYEGSNDVRFVYGRMEGPRSEGSSATIGMQNVRRDLAVQSGFNADIVGPGWSVTYRFDNGAYTAELIEPAPAGQPIVTDAGDRTASLTELSASWIEEGGLTGAVEFDYSIGTTPGGSDVRPFTTVEANSVIASGLKLLEGVTYYFAVRAKNAAGIVSRTGISNGIVVDPSFVASVKVFPSISETNGAFAGLALVAEADTDVVLRAVNPDGSLQMGLGIRNPFTLKLPAGQQWARRVSEIFGLPAFDGWVELEASQASLHAYTATGSGDLTEFDGASPSAQSRDFYFFHPGAVAVLVNPSLEPVTATVTDLVTHGSRAVAIPARSRWTTPITGPVRVTATAPIAGVERISNGGNLAIGEAVSSSVSLLRFPHAVVGGGYRTWIHVVNTIGVPIQVSLSFGSRSQVLLLDPHEAKRFSLGEMFPVAGGAIQTGPVRVQTGGVFKVSGLVGVIDIETDHSTVTSAAVKEAQMIVFPHVANGQGFFTGIAIAAGSTPADVLIEVFDASGTQTGRGTASVPANGSLARLLDEYLPGFGVQSGGYIRLTADHPVAAWEIYGTGTAMGSGPAQ